jgi:hypothetical protein
MILEASYPGSVAVTAVHHRTMPRMIDWALIWLCSIFCNSIIMLIVRLQDVNNGKPHPETFLKAASLIGVEPQHVVGYEDAPLGMIAIKSAGFMKAIDVTLLDGYPRMG